MLDAQFLDVVIGLTFVYLALSLICSGINEWIAQVSKARARYLRDWVEHILTDNTHTDLLARFEEHPLIKALSPGRKRGAKVVGPSYIKPDSFVLVLLDLVTPLDLRGNGSINQLRMSLSSAAMPEELKKTLLALIDSAGDDIDKVRNNIQVWFNDSMERLSGVYKRKTRFVLLMLAIFITLAMNVNSLQLFTAFHRDSALRATIIASAERAAMADDVDREIVIRELEALDLPIGWGDSSYQPILGDPISMALALAGWLLTVLAVSQGASFWFDLLNKFVNVRTTGARPDTKPSPERDGAA